MKKRPFEYIVLHHPKATDEQRKTNTEPDSTIIVDKTMVMAGDDRQAGLRAARSIPQEFEEKLDEVEIIVRPF